MVEISRVQFDFCSEDETEKAPAQSIVFPVPMELLKAESGCSTVLQW